MKDFSIDDFVLITDSEPCNETGYPEAAGICTLVTGIDRLSGRRVQAVFDALDLRAISPRQKAFLVLESGR